jgi:hypothetical protein
MRELGQIAPRAARVWWILATYQSGYKWAWDMLNSYVHAMVEESWACRRIRCTGCVDSTKEN